MGFVLLLLVAPNAHTRAHKKTTKKPSTYAAVAFSILFCITLSLSLPTTTATTTLHTRNKLRIPFLLLYLLLAFSDVQSRTTNRTHSCRECLLVFPPMYPTPSCLPLFPSFFSFLRTTCG
uniref:Uncharacterized protein n=1 Tax=Palpitomonas bilix TaxID=652834 RepID=A0A7S3CUY6_9EUKA